MNGSEGLVEDLMHRDFVSLRPGDSLLEAERIMRLGRIRHLPIVEDGQVVGVLSHRDLVEGAISSAREVPTDARIEHLRATTVEQLMRPDPWTVDAKTPLSEAAVRMLSLKIGCLPVVEPGSARAIIGLITESDLLRAAYAFD